MLLCCVFKPPSTFLSPPFSIPALTLIFISHLPLFYLLSKLRCFCLLWFLFSYSSAWSCLVRLPSSFSTCFPHVSFSFGNIRWFLLLALPRAYSIFPFYFSISYYYYYHYYNNPPPCVCVSVHACVRVNKLRVASLPR